MNLKKIKKKMSHNCPKCKFPLKPNAKFCRKCGSKLEGSSQDLNKIEIKKKEPEIIKKEPEMKKVEVKNENIKKTQNVDIKIENSTEEKKEMKIDLKQSLKLNIAQIQIDQSQQPQTINLNKTETKNTICFNCKQPLTDFNDKILQCIPCGKKFQKVMNTPRTSSTPRSRVRSLTTTAKPDPNFSVSATPEKVQVTKKVIRVSVDKPQTRTSATTLSPSRVPIDQPKLTRINSDNQLTPRPTQVTVENKTIQRIVGTRVRSNTESAKKVSNVTASPRKTISNQNLEKPIKRVSSNNNIVVKKVIKKTVAKKPTETTTQSTSNCANCKTVLRANAKFCFKCGTKVEIPKVEEPKKENKSSIATIISIQKAAPTKATIPIVFKCCKCKKPFKTMPKFCPFCGAKQESSSGSSIIKKSSGSGSMIQKGANSELRKKIFAEQRRLRDLQKQMNEKQEVLQNIESGKTPRIVLTPSNNGEIDKLKEEYDIIRNNYFLLFLFFLLLY